MAKNEDDELEQLLGGLPPIVQEEDVAELVEKLLAAKCRPLVFYRREDLVAVLRALRAAPRRRAGA